MELEVSSQFFGLLESLFVTVSWFRLQSTAIHCNRRAVYTDTPHARVFLDIFDFVHTSHCGSRCRSVCLTKKSLMHMSSHVWAFVVSLLCPHPLSLAPLLSLSLSICSLSCSSTSMWSKPPRNKTTALTHNEEHCPVAIHNPLTGYEPNLLDYFDYSETSAAIF